MAPLSSAVSTSRQRAALLPVKAATGASYTLWIEYRQAVGVDKSLGAPLYAANHTRQNENKMGHSLDFAGAATRVHPAGAWARRSQRVALAISNDGHNPQIERVVLPGSRATPRGSSSPRPRTSSTSTRT